MKIPRDRLLATVESLYRASAPGALDNDALYRAVAETHGIPESEVSRTTEICRARQRTSPFKREVRWVQQILKSEGIITRLPGRGRWRYSDPDTLTPAPAGMVVLGFFTDAGIALWGTAAGALREIDEPIHLCLTSPPYPLRQPRAYGNPRSEQEYIDFLCRELEPLIPLLSPGGSLALNLGNDIFVPGSPARSLYRERLLLALCDRFGLHKMDELIWAVPNKPPTPSFWACSRRVQLRAGYEPIYWLTNDPSRVRTDNRRVLEPHTERMKRLIARGGERKRASHSDNSHRRRPGSYGAPTPGRIPTNVLQFPTTDPHQRKAKALARSAGLPAHGAPFPQALAEFLIRFLSRKGDLVIDPFAGSFTTAAAAERLGRRWIGVERIREYVAGAGLRLAGAPGFQPGPAL